MKLSCKASESNILRTDEGELTLTFDLPFESNRCSSVTYDFTVIFLFLSTFNKKFLFKNFFEKTNSGFYTILESSLSWKRLL